MLRHKKTVHGFRETETNDRESDDQSEDVAKSDEETMQEDQTDDDDESTNEKDINTDNSDEETDTDNADNDVSPDEDDEEEDIWHILKSKARSKIGVTSVDEVENIDEDKYNDLRHEMRNKIINYYVTLCNLWSVCKDDLTHMETQNTKRKTINEKC